MNKPTFPTPSFVVTSADMASEGLLVKIEIRRVLMAGFTCPVFVTSSVWKYADGFDKGEDAGLLLKQALLDCAATAMDGIKEQWVKEGLDTKTAFEGPFTVAHKWHPELKLWLAWNYADGVTICYPRER